MTVGNVVEVGGLLNININNKSLFRFVQKYWLSWNHRLM